MIAGCKSATKTAIAINTVSWCEYVVRFRDIVFSWNNRKRRADSNAVPQFVYPTLTGTISSDLYQGTCPAGTTGDENEAELRIPKTGPAGEDGVPDEPGVGSLG